MTVMTRTSGPAQLLNPASRLSLDECSLPVPTGPKVSMRTVSHEFPPSVVVGLQFKAKFLPIA